jgi:hypothetical protein
MTSKLTKGALSLSGKGMGKVMSLLPVKKPKPKVQAKSKGSK